MKFYTLEIFKEMVKRKKKGKYKKKKLYCTDCGTRFKDGDVFYNRTDGKFCQVCGIKRGVL